MIPRTYHDGNQEDRAYLSDYWSWLERQPQDAWLLWARWANWDNADTIFENMVARKDCDLSLVSWIFWGTQPAYYVRNPGAYSGDSLIGTIVFNVERGFYGPATLFCDRSEVAINAIDYVKALRDAGRGPAPFALPRTLCGPFEGRPAALPARYDDETEQGLAEVFAHLDGCLPRSEAEHATQMAAGGLSWIKDNVRLPRVPANPVAAFAHLDDAAYVEAVFGPAAAHDAARARMQRGANRPGWWPFG